MSGKTAQPRCSETIIDRFHSYGCTRRAVVERKGKGYCRQHDPEAIAARRKAATDAWRAQAEVERSAEARSQAVCDRLGVGSPSWASLKRIGTVPRVRLTIEEAEGLALRLDGLDTAVRELTRERDRLRRELRRRGA